MSSLSLQQVPSLRLPVGYFLVGPWMGVLAGCYLAFHGEAAWTSRWTPAVMGATHLLVLGCIAMVMMGALLQVLPVISSASVPGADRTAAWIRTLLGVGAIVLAFALADEVKPLFWVAGGALVLAFGVYLAPLIWSLGRRVGGGDSMIAVRIAVLCLLVTVVLGVGLVWGHLAPREFPTFRAWTTTHFGFGLVGWVAVLIMAVSFQVLPMFFVAPDYPRWITLGAPLAIPVGLVLGNAWIVGAACAGWALFTLLVLHRRKRRAPDPVVWFWQLATVVLAATTAVWWFTDLTDWTVGVLYVVGFVLTVMTGMLYKIVPFLVFLHLQRACLYQPEKFKELPTMHTVIPVRRAKWQFGMHVVTVAACVTATWIPALGPWAALLLAADCAWLGWSVRFGWSCYVRKLAELQPSGVDSQQAMGRFGAGAVGEPAAEPTTR